MFNIFTRSAVGLFFSCCSLLFIPATAFSKPVPLPKIIDFSNLGEAEHFFLPKLDFDHIGAFNGAPELGSFFNYLKKRYRIDTVIETGTYYGTTSILFSLLFNEVHTIEISEMQYLLAVENLKPYPNVFCHLGSSEKSLKYILPNFKQQRLLFYLDAHWLDKWPLLDELKEISKTHRDNCIIVIDDFKVPDRKDIPYDSYGNKGCSYDYIKDQLNKVYSDYTFHYVIPKSISARAKFVAIPKKWKR